MWQNGDQHYCENFNIIMISPLTYLTVSKTVLMEIDTHAEDETLSKNLKKKCNPQEANFSLSCSICLSPSESHNIRSRIVWKANTELQGGLMCRKPNRKSQKMSTLGQFQFFHFYLLMSGFLVSLWQNTGIGTPQTRCREIHQ